MENKGAVTAQGHAVEGGGLCGGCVAAASGGAVDDRAVAGGSRVPGRDVARRGARGIRAGVDLAAVILTRFQVEAAAPACRRHGRGGEKGHQQREEDDEGQSRLLGARHDRC